ncbi:hypothetical protein EJ08DRAFT_697104 [Tothia fuscella]|uniref:Uncharacterized protein n=1 Tax=Tothia fuscella TaxID=1048955 RepID=A0A9P4NS30_9PEZI|nr:hypothetical protein EJ08DRAFT_697104 [Tothia fuscella]
MEFLKPNPPSPASAPAQIRANSNSTTRAMSTVTNPHITLTPKKKAISFSQYKARDPAVKKFDPDDAVDSTERKDLTPRSYSSTDKTTNIVSVAIERSASEEPSSDPVLPPYTAVLPVTSISSNSSRVTVPSVGFKYKALGPEAVRLQQQQKQELVAKVKQCEAELTRAKKALVADTEILKLFATCFGPGFIGNVQAYLYYVPIASVTDSAFSRLSCKVKVHDDAFDKCYENTRNASSYFSSLDHELAAATERDFKALNAQLEALDFFQSYLGRSCVTMDGTRAVNMGTMFEAAGEAVESLWLEDEECGGDGHGHEEDGGVEGLQKKIICFEKDVESTGNFARKLVKMFPWIKAKYSVQKEDSSMVAEEKNEMLAQVDKWTKDIEDKIPPMIADLKAFAKEEQLSLDKLIKTASVSGLMNDILLSGGIAAPTSHTPVPFRLTNGYESRNSSTRLTIGVPQNPANVKTSAFTFVSGTPTKSGDFSQHGVGPSRKRSRTGDDDEQSHSGESPPKRTRA